MLKDILRLYVENGRRVLDMTWGRGTFWKAIPADDYQLTTLDLYTAADVRADFRQLPFAPGAFDAVVFDPPYAGRDTGVSKDFRDRYGLKRGPNTSIKAVYELYRGGLEEARRVLVIGGVAIVKCQDQIESGRQRWLHVRVLETAGFTPEDMFVVMRRGTPIMRHPYQYHARKNHSYFVVLRKSL